jgi:ribosome-binding ATPase YchF (GTP1/OBG family)
MIVFGKEHLKIIMNITNLNQYNAHHQNEQVKRVRQEIQKIQSDLIPIREKLELTKASSLKIGKLKDRIVKPIKLPVAEIEDLQSVLAYMANTLQLASRECPSYFVQEIKSIRDTIQRLMSDSEMYIEEHLKTYSFDNLIRTIHFDYF